MLLVRQPLPHDDESIATVPDPFHPPAPHFTTLALDSDTTNSFTTLALDSDTTNSDNWIEGYFTISLHGRLPGG
jgi:hypothetical protein